MSRKWLITLLVISIFTLPSLSFVSAQATCDGEEVTLRLDDWSSGDRVEYMNQVLDAFMAENPCITVVAEPNIGDDQNTRRLTMIASGTAPDLIATGESWIPMYAQAGGFLDLTPYRMSKAKMASTLRKSSTKAFTIRVSIRASPLPSPKTTA